MGCLGAPVRRCTRSRNSLGSTRYTLGGAGAGEDEEEEAAARQGLAGGFCTALSAASAATGLRLIAAVDSPP